MAFKHTLDYFNKQKIPNFLLRNPNGKNIAIISHAINKKATYRYNGLSELTFTVSKMLDGKLVKYYDQLVAKKQVLIEENMCFVITNVETVKNGLNEYKEVTCSSLEGLFVNKTVMLLENAYDFYGDTPSQIDQSFLGSMMKFAPNGWTVGYVSSSLIHKNRYFEVAEANLYELFINNAEEAYQCVFDFDTLTKKVNVYDITEATTKPSFIISFLNLAKELKLNDGDTSQLVTALQCTGSNCDIADVNPLGGNYIFNFDYFKTTEWISQELIDAINVWEEKIKVQQPIYANLLTQLKTKNEELITLESKLTDLKGELTGLEKVRSLDISRNVSDLTDITNKVNTKQLEVNNKQGEINSKNTEITTNKNQLQAINDLLSFENNFTPTLYDELKNIIFEGTYSDSSFTASDGITPVKLQELSQDLYNQSIEQLKKLSQPRYTFDATLVDLLKIPELANIAKKFKLGSQMCIELDNGQYFYPVLLEIPVNYEETDESFSCKFSNRLKLSEQEFNLVQLLKDSLQSASNTAQFSNQWGSYQKSGAKDKLEDFFDHSFDITNKEIISSSSQDIQIGDYGLMCRKKLDDGTFSPKEWRGTNGVIAFTDSGWTGRPKTALGEITLPNGLKEYGLNAEVIMGKQILGNNLTISNENATIELGNTAKFKDCSIELTRTNGKNKILHDAEFGIKIQKLNGSTWEDKLWLDGDGNIHANDLFASNGNFTGKITGSEITGSSFSTANGSARINADGYAEFSNINISGNSNFSGNIDGSEITGSKFTAGTIDIDTDITVGKKIFLNKGYETGIYTNSGELMLGVKRNYVMGDTLYSDFNLNLYTTGILCNNITSNTDVVAYMGEFTKSLRIGGLDVATKKDLQDINVVAKFG